jgi:hypothetical protein
MQRYSSSEVFPRHPGRTAAPVHLHSIALDGSYAESDAGELAFHPLPLLSNDDVADILQIAQPLPARCLTRCLSSTHSA